MTAAEELVLIDAAIAKIYAGGQAYTVDGQSMTRADLPALLARKERLAKQVARAARGGMRVRVGLPR